MYIQYRGHDFRRVFTSQPEQVALRYNWARSYSSTHHDVGTQESLFSHPDPSELGTHAETLVTSSSINRHHVQLRS
jgi:hypothetical protein